MHDGRILRHSLWVLVDEIYALSRHDGDGAPFRSVLSLPVPDPQRTIWTWALSKVLGPRGCRGGDLWDGQDLCMPGLRVTLMTSGSAALLAVARKLILYSCIPAPAQAVAARLLSDFRPPLLFRRRLRRQSGVQAG